MTATHMVFDAGVAGEPHPGNFEVCKHLENIWWAQSARKILDEGLPADAVGLSFPADVGLGFPPSERRKERARQRRRTGAVPGSSILRC